MKNLKLTMEVVFQMGAECPEPPDGLVESINYSLQDWSDGRYGFSTELLHESLARIVAGAFEDAVRKSMKPGFDREEAMRNVRVYLSEDDLKVVEISQVEVE